jgi:hypothetical protein
MPEDAVISIVEFMQDYPNEEEAMVNFANVLITSCVHKHK